MKNRIKKIIGIVLIVLVLIALAVFAFYFFKQTDADKFRKEYSTLEISKNNPVEYLTDQTVTGALSKGDKLVFLGKPSSKKTIYVIETLLKVLSDNDIEKIYYYNLESGSEETVKLVESKINNVTFDDSTLILVKNDNIEKYYINEKDDLNKDDRKELYAAYEDIILSFIMCSSQC